MSTATVTAPKRAKGMFPFLAMRVITFLYALGYTSFYPILPFICHHASSQGSVAVNYGLLTSAYWFTKCFSGPTWGVVGDRVGLHRTLPLLLFVNGALQLLTLLLHANNALSFSTVLFVRLVQGMCSSCGAAVQSLKFNALGAQASSSLEFTLCWKVAYMVVPLFVFFCEDSMVMLLSVSMLCFLTAAFLSLVFLKDVTKIDNESDAAAPAEAKIEPASKPGFNFVKELTQSFAHPKLAWAMMFSSVIILPNPDMFPILMERWHVTPSVLADRNNVSSIVSVVLLLSPIASLITSTLGPQLVCALGLLLDGVVLFLLPFAPTLQAISAVLILRSLLSSLIDPAENVFMQGLSKPGHTATAQGIREGMKGLTEVFTALFSAYSISSSVALPFWFSGLAHVCKAVLVVLATKEVVVKAKVA